MTMTRKDYIRFAGLLNSVARFPEDMLSYEVKKFLVNNMCEIFEDDNKNFNRMKFKEAVYERAN